MARTEQKVGSPHSQRLQLVAKVRPTWQQGVVVLGAAAVLALVVAIVQAQDSFKRPEWSAVPSASSGKKGGGLAERLQAVRRSSVFDDEQPAASPPSAPIVQRESTRPDEPDEDPREFSVQPASNSSPGAEPEAEPQKLIPPQPPSAFEDEGSAESLPSVLKRGATANQPSPPSRSSSAGEFVAPRAVVAEEKFTPPAPPVRSARSPEAQPSSRRTAKAPPPAARSQPPTTQPQETEQPPAYLPAAAARPQPASRPQQPERATLISSQSPALRVDTLGPAAIKIGKEAVYTVQVANPGDVEARDVAVTIDLPAWVQATGSDATSGAVRRQGTNDDTQLVWHLDRLAGRGQEQLHLKLSPQENKPFELGVDWQCSQPRGAARIEVQEPQLAMTLSGPKEMLFGETAIYTITLSNPGTGDADNVTVSLLPPPGSARGKETSRVGTVAAGQQKQIEIELSAREAGTMEVRVGAEADGGLHGDAVANILVRRASLEVALDGPQLKYAGSPATYQARVTNTGNAPAEDVSAVVLLPVGARLLAGTDGVKAASGGAMWQLGKLAAGVERVLEFECELGGGGENRLEFKVKAASNLSAAAEFITKVEALADLKLTVVDPKGPRPVGENTVYEVKIANRGSKAARQVNVVVQFSDGIEPTGAEGGKSDLVPGQVIFHPLARIDAGEETTLRITARAEREGNHVFRAEIKCSDPETRLVYEGTTRYFGSDASRTASPVAPTAKKPAELQLR